MKNTFDEKSSIVALCALACEKFVLGRVVFSRPKSAGDASKVSGRLCRTGRGVVLSLEFSLGTTVRQTNVSAAEVSGMLSDLSGKYLQINLITSHGDAEYKVSKSGKPVLLGSDKLLRKLTDGKIVSDLDGTDWEKQIEEIDRKKNYILRGDEDFLIELGVSDKNGRIHDKKRAKYRQINRFLEHVRDVYPDIKGGGVLRVYDLCCGKSYLSFALYYYLRNVCGRDVEMTCVDIREDVVVFCSSLCAKLGYDNLRFFQGDVKEFPLEKAPDLVVSLHACDIATDIVLARASQLGARVILSTPCCHAHLRQRICAPELKFVTDYPQLSGKLCEALTDALRLAKLKSEGYRVSALELTDPEDTPKNTLLRAVMRPGFRVLSPEGEKLRAEYEKILNFVLGAAADTYLSEI